MSRRQKTIKELMEEALIPKEEHSNDLPDNWNWVNLGSVITLISGRDLSIKYCNREARGIPYIMGASNIKGNELHIERWIENPTVIGLKGDILISVKGTVGKIINQELEEVHLSRQIMALRSKDIIVNKFLYFYIESYIEKFEKAAKGIIPGISRDDILNAPFPLPPLSEQKWIVVKVERLLSKIDEAKQLIEEAKETLKVRQMAFVNNLFEGSSGKKVGIISDIADVKGGKRLPKGEDLVNEDTGFPYIKAGDLKNGTVLIDKLQFLLPSTQEKIKNYIVSAGDVYITIVGACIGDVGVVPREFDGANLTENAAKLTHLNNCLPEYLALWLSSNKAQNLIKESIASATLGKLSLTRIKNLPIPLLNIEFQLKLVDEYEKFIEKEMKITQNLERIDLDELKQSILSKAFRGELGTNDPSEKSAIELLKEVLHEQVK